MNDAKTLDLPEKAGWAQPRKFLEVSGRRAALLGHENGSFECWMWPVKVCHDLSLRFQLASGGSALAGRDLVSHVSVRPDRVVLTYVHEAFTVRQTLFAALDHRLIAMLIDVDSPRDLVVQVTFAPDMRPMWPAGFGGQIATQDAVTGATFLTEELGRFGVLLGSPGAPRVSIGADHALPRDPVTIPLTWRATDSEPLIFLIAGAEVVPDQLPASAEVGEHGAATGLSRIDKVREHARAAYRDGSTNWSVRLAEVRSHWRRFLDRTTLLQTSDPAVDDAFLWAKIAIEKSWVEVDGLGRSLVAGLAPSAGSDRPGFGWFFDGDALCAARAMAAYGDTEGQLRVLGAAASRQRSDGKLMHELTLSSRLCNWLEDYPYAYYKAPNSPDFVAALELCLRHNGDRPTLERLFTNAKRAVQWCHACLDQNGLMTNRKAGLAAVEAGSLVGVIRSEVYLHGMYLSALRALERLAGWIGEKDVAHWATTNLAHATSAFESFWSEKAGRYGFALLTDGKWFDDLNAYLAEPLAAGHGETARAHASVQGLNDPALCSDWGVRMFARTSAIYDPANYNTGSVFPYLTNFVILAHYRHGLTAAGWQIYRSQVALSDFSGRGFVPEHLIGDRCTAPERGVPHQVFSSTTIVQGAIFGILGIEADAFEGVLRIRPALPPHWRRATVTHMRVGPTLLDLRVERDRGGDGTTYHVWAFIREGPSLALDITLSCPPLTQLGSAVVNRRDVPSAAVRPAGGSVAIEVGRHAILRELACTVVVREGPQLLLEAPELREGARSRSVRLTRTEIIGATSVRWTLQGLSGSTARARLFADREMQVQGAAVEARGEAHLDFPAGDGDSFVSHVVEVTVG